MTAPKTLLWDENEIKQAKALDYIKSGIAQSQTEAHELGAHDAELLEFAFHDFLEDFDAILRHISKDDLFFIEGRNMGWRHLSGHLGLTACDARVFIARAFPRTSEWTLRGEYDRRRRTLSFTLWHHDAPTGEQYTVRRGFKYSADIVDAAGHHYSGPVAISLKDNW
jgi:hypothetical protein